MHKKFQYYLFIPLVLGGMLFSCHRETALEVEEVTLIPVEESTYIVGSFREYTGDNNQCLKCHSGIEHIREEESEMMEAIFDIADSAGFNGNDCIVCHGGSPTETDAEKAHNGTIAYFLTNKGPKEFYPDPGSPWINVNTCGMCHEEQVRTQFTSLMFTEAGKIQGSLWGFGGMNGYNHDVGNYNVSEVDVHYTLGTDVYKEYIARLKKEEPQVFPSSMMELPAAPTKEEVQEDPTLAVYTYLRQECQRCHTGNKGRQQRGDYRGMGCSSCHIPYSNEGYYEGADSAISKEPGHLLVHRIQGTRDAKVAVNGISYSGIPVETCTTCHDRGKRIGTSFQGLMETAYSSPFMGDGEGQEKLHSKNYLHLHADIHKDKGMLCQDCHTSIDVHSDGTLAGTTLAPVEIECQDCHGTTSKYPWELPLGYSDEVTGTVPASGADRGVTFELLPFMKLGTVYFPQDGYLLTARGNPYGNVVRKGDTIIVHTAGGKDINLMPLKYLEKNNKLSYEGRIAMVNVSKHMETMECYACHADWAPQCYGCHIKVDYSKPCKKNPDWLAMGASHDEHGQTADARGDYEEFLIDGEVTEQRSYLRWENPPLVMNGEHRISTAIPGCQTTITVIGEDGEALLLNHIFKIPNVEGAGEEGQLAIDVSPVQPHTISKNARKCEDCHTNPASMGYGIGGGNIYEDPSKEYIVDLTTADGKVLPKKRKVQVNAIPNLHYDWSRIVSEEGEQLQTVGHHFSGSRPLNNDERNSLDRRGVCASCHDIIPDGDLAVSLLTHIGETAGLEIDTSEHNKLLKKNIQLSAWFQLLIGAFIGAFVVLIILKLKKRRMQSH